MEIHMHRACFDIQSAERSHLADRDGVVVGRHSLLLRF